MPAAIIDGKAVARNIEEQSAAAVARMLVRGVRPVLVAIRVGNDPASEIYVRNKVRKAEELGIAATVRHFDASLSEPELLAQLGALNRDDGVDGILVQLPLPNQINSRHVIEAIDPRKDVDGFHPINVGKLHLAQPALLPCTPAGVIRLIESTGVDIRGKHAVVVGRSDIVGKPAAALLLQRDATVTIGHSKTADLAALTREAEILVVAVGRPHMIRGEMVREGAVVIDVGINRLEAGPASRALLGRSPDKLRGLEEKGSAIVGDVEFATVREKASWITPVPGGVGPMTIAMLMENTIKACQERRG